MTPRGRLAAAAMACMLLAAAPPARAYELVTTDAADPVAWTGSCVEVWLHPGVVAELDDATVLATLATAAAPWNEVACSAVRLTPMGATCFDDVGLADWPGPQNVVLGRDAEGSWTHAERVVALTSVTFDNRSGEIVDADIELNGEDYTFAVDGSGDHYDLQQTLTHELGHVLGLDHTDVVAATMYATSHPGETRKRTLHQDDVDGVCANHPASIGGAPIVCQGTTEPAPLDAPWCPEANRAPDCAGGGPGGGDLRWALLVGLAALATRRRGRAVRP